MLGNFDYKGQNIMLDTKNDKMKTKKEKELVLVELLLSIVPVLIEYLLKSKSNTQLIFIHLPSETPHC